MAGLGYRREMADWDMSQVRADFFEVAPENWIRRDCSPLLRLRQSGRPVHLHGVSLNLGGDSPIDQRFLHAVRSLMQELDTIRYSDHLAASGDAHQLYDLFPIPFTQDEVRRVGDRIRRVQDILGLQIAIENSTWYTNVGDMPEPEFLSAVADWADCLVLLDLNNIVVNFKNHGQCPLDRFVAGVDLARVSYMHVAGHEFDERFGLFIDTHSETVEVPTMSMACQLQRTHGLDVLLEWDNDVPSLDTLNQELSCLTPFMTT